MTQPFGASAGLILVKAEVSGPSRTAVATLVLDTGATTTSLNATCCAAVGYDPDSAAEFVSLTTGTRVERVPASDGQSADRLGRHAIGLRVLAHDLPTEAAVDGLLGLDCRQRSGIEPLSRLD